MSETTRAILSGLMAAIWLWLAWRALNTTDFIGFKRGTVGYAVVAGLFIAVGLGAALQAMGL